MCQSGTYILHICERPCASTIVCGPGRYQEEVYAVHENATQTQKSNKQTYKYDTQKHINPKTNTHIKQKQTNTHKYYPPKPKIKQNRV